MYEIFWSDLPLGLSQCNMPNTDESEREKQLHNELKEIASLGNPCAAFGCANFFGY